MKKDLKRKQEVMENNNVFSYQYSADRQKEIERIREKYMQNEESKLERLKRLDLKVQMAGQLQALCIGIVGALIFGVGMCYGLDVLVGADWLSVLFGAAGIATMIPAYPVYKLISKKTKAQLTPEILKLSEEIMNS